MAFRIGSTRELLTASGQPAFNAAAFDATFVVTDGGDGRAMVAVDNEGCRLL